MTIIGAIEISTALTDSIASWKRVFDGRSTSVDPRGLLLNAARELHGILKIDRTVHPESELVARQEAIDALHDMATFAGVGDGDAQAIFAQCFQDHPAGQGANILDFPTGTLLDEASATTTVTIKPSEQFVAEFVPPDYMVDGVMQEGFLYSLTGQTGAGKTVITLRLAASVALSTPFADRETKKKRVLYLAAENPDDVRMRWIALSQHMDFDIDTIEVYFIEGVFKISQMADGLRKKAERLGGSSG